MAGVAFTRSVQHVVETASGFEFGGSVYPTLVAALDAARSAVAPDREPVFAEDGAPVGVFRWLDAAAAETAADYPDGHIDDTTIHEMAASLNGNGKPVPIDGGAVVGLSPSPVHGTADDTGTPANGWAHAGVPVLRADGALHLFLYSELWPTVAAEVDRGRIAYGSVLLSATDLSETGGYRGVRLIGHALTNDPANRRLAPSTAVRSADSGALVLRSSSTRLRGNMKIRKSAEATAEAKPEEKPAPVEASRAEAPPPEAPAEEGPASGEMDVEALKARIVELEAQLAAALAEASARTPSEEDMAKEAAAKEAAREAEINAELERGIREGRFLPVSRPHFEKVARSHGVESLRQLLKGLTARALPLRQAAAKEASPESASPIDPADPLVIAMRAANVPDSRIAAALAGRKKEI